MFLFPLFFCVIIFQRVSAADTFSKGNEDNAAATRINDAVEICQVFNSSYTGESSVICFKYCRGLYSQTLDLKCTYKGETVKCDKASPPRTKVSIQCKNKYVPVEGSKVVTESECLVGGRWTEKLFECVPECGIHNTDPAKLLISNGHNVSNGEYPWVAGIYQKNNIFFEQVCVGTIINPHTILTAAHCVYNDKLQIKKPVADFRVVVGKYRRPWNVSDVFMQKKEVHEIRIPSRYNGRRNFYELDIAVLDLVNNIEFSDQVMPACMTWMANQILFDSPNGTVVGWGVSEYKVFNEELKAVYLPFIDHNTCIEGAEDHFVKYVTADKFCAGYKNGTNVKMGDSGSGITFTHNEFGRKKHYIYGLVSVKPLKEDVFVVFTNISTTLLKDWLNKTMNELIEKHKSPIYIAVNEKGECLLPDLQDGRTFKVIGCNERDKSSKCLGISETPVEVNTTLSVSCEVGYLMAGTNETTCVNGTWTPSVPDCIKMCPPQNSSELYLKCSYKSVKRDCDIYLPPGAKLQSSCKKGTTFADKTEYKPRIECYIGGKWSNPLYGCKSFCGSFRNERDRVPWHTGIYWVKDGVEKYLCSGTMIYRTLIMVEASCLDPIATGDYISFIRVVVPKFHRPHNIQDIDSFSYRVYGLHVPPEWNTTKPTDFPARMYNFALLDIVPPRPESEINAQPACRGFVMHKNFPVTYEGYLTGWRNSTERDEEQIQLEKVKILDVKDCGLNNSNLKTQFYCIQYANGSRVDAEPGSGVVVNEENFYNLFALVTKTPEELTKYNMTLVTGLNYYRQWTRKRILSLIVSQNYKKEGILPNYDVNFIVNKIEPGF